MNTFPNKITNPFVQFDLHDGLYVPPWPPMAGRRVHIGGGRLSWARRCGQNHENDHTVFADGLEVVSRDHEVSRLVVPHLSIPPVNLFMPLQILGSSNKCKFAAINVILPDGPMAVSIFGGHVGLNTACSDPVSAPTSLVYNWGTVDVHFGLNDLIAAVLQIALDSLIDYVLHRLTKAAQNAIPRGVKKAVCHGFLKKISQKLGLKSWRMLTRYRGAKGMFRSMSEMVFDTALGTAIGEAFSLAVDAPGISTVVDATKPAIDSFADWITGRSERLTGDQPRGSNAFQDAVREMAWDCADRTGTDITDQSTEGFGDSLLSGLANSTEVLHIEGALLEKLEASAGAKKLDQEIMGDIAKGKTSGTAGCAFGGGPGEWTLKNIPGKLRAGQNELTWVVRSAAVEWQAHPQPDGSYLVEHSFNDTFDLRPDWQNRGVEYNVATTILGGIYHDIVGGSTTVQHRARWESIIPPGTGPPEP